MPDTIPLIPNSPSLEEGDDRGLGLPIYFSESLMTLARVTTDENRNRSHFLDTSAEASGRRSGEGLTIYS